MFESVVSGVYKSAAAVTAGLGRVYPAAVARWLPLDRLLHAAAGAATVAVTAGAGFSAELGLLLSAAAGVFKELLDAVTGRGQPDSWDALATYAGGLTVYLAVTAADGGISPGILFASAMPALIILLVSSHRS